MEILGFSYQFNMFINSIDMKPNQDTLVKVMPLVADGFMPATADENSEDGVRTKVFKVEKDVNDKKTAITFGSKVVNVVISAPEGITHENIFSELDSIFQKLNNILPEKSGVRVSCVTTIIIKSDKNTETKMYKKTFSDDPVYMEWSSRKAKKEKMGDEEIFNVLTINKGAALKHTSGSITQIDAIILTIDNNTVPENNNERFSFINSSIFRRLQDRSEKEIDVILE